MLLADILEAIAKIENYTLNLNKETFLNDGKTVDAVVRNLEVIGKAGNRLHGISSLIPYPDFYKDTPNCRKPTTLILSATG